ncbi:MAG: ribonuclease HII [Sporichthyaceae bacterium]
MRPRRFTVRADAGLYGYERALINSGLGPVAGADEAGRGACAGPLVAAAVILAPGKRGEIPGLADSKLLTAGAREDAYAQIQKRAAAIGTVIVPAAEVDRVGLHRANVAALRRALARLDVQAGYVLTDGFAVAGLGVPGLAVWKGDRVAGCIAAASVVAKVTRDRIMCELAREFPQYGFDGHKGYVTAEHTAALHAYGPCIEHRYSYVNVAAAVEASGLGHNERRSRRMVEEEVR